MDQPAILTDDEKARYDAAWHKYRINTRWFFWLFISWMPGVIGTIWLLSFIVSYKIAYNIIGPIIAISWMVAWLVSGIIYGQFRCPRCGKTFFATKLFGWLDYHNPYSRKCLNCGLRVYTCSGR